MDLTFRVGGAVNVGSCCLSLGLFRFLGLLFLLLAGVEVDELDVVVFAV